MMITKINNATFFEIIKRFEDGKSENLLVFPLEYFIEESYVYLYKTVENKTYSTEVGIIEGTVILGDGELSFEEFINDLKVNMNGIELVSKYPENVVLRIKQV